MYSKSVIGRCFMLSWPWEEQMGKTKVVVYEKPT